VSPVLTFIVAATKNETVRSRLYLSLTERMNEMKNKNGVPIMKSAVGALAVLLLVSALAIGQQHSSYAEPFPQSANPALANGTADESSPSVNAGLPSSMAINQSVFAGSNRADLGSPFPQAANPSLVNGTAGGSSPSIGHSTAEGGSPFPSAANPSSNR
jgi:hypothetical protein